MKLMLLSNLSVRLPCEKDSLAFVDNPATLVPGRRHLVFLVLHRPCVMDMDSMEFVDNPGTLVLG